MKVTRPNSTLKADTDKPLHRTQGLRPTGTHDDAEGSVQLSESSSPRTGRSEGRGIRRPTQPRRDWTQAREKLEREGTCRLCDDPRVQAAHVIGREHDKPKRCATCKGTGLRQDRDVQIACWVCNGSGWLHELLVAPDSIIPLCRAHHTAYDHHEIEVLSVLSLAEQLRAVEDAGGIELARMRTAPLAYREGA